MLLVTDLGSEHYDRFGGGFELMRDGDVRRIWKQLEVRVA